MLARLLVTLLATSTADPAVDGLAPTPPVPPAEPLVIAHRGASALLPEHTLAAYARAIADGGDWIEPDLVATRDGVLVARHENGIGDTTDVASRPEFADRRRVQWVDGREVEDWFTEDFTLAELRTLRARERLPELRGDAHDGRYPVPTLEEIIALAARESAARGRVIGLVPLGTATTLVADAHAAGLQVLPYTFRPEDPLLPPALRADGAPGRNEAGAIAEIQAYLEAGIDGFFADDPALGRRAVEAARRPAKPLAVPE